MFNPQILEHCGIPHWRLDDNVTNQITLYAAAGTKNFLSKIVRTGQDAQYPEGFLKVSIRFVKDIVKDTPVDISLCLKDMSKYLYL